MEGNFILNQEREMRISFISQLLKDFITASELKILGLQRQGFYAFADGVYNDNSFHKVKNGWCCKCRMLCSSE
jgi:hypothetical protein